MKRIRRGLLAAALLAAPLAVPAGAAYATTDAVAVADIVTSRTLCVASNGSVSLLVSGSACPSGSRSTPVATAEYAAQLASQAQSLTKQVTDAETLQLHRERLAPKLVARIEAGGRMTVYGWGLWPGTTYGVKTGENGSDGLCTISGGDSLGRWHGTDSTTCPAPVSLQRDFFGNYIVCDVTHGACSDRYAFESYALRVLNDYGVPIEFDVVPDVASSVEPALQFGSPPPLAAPPALHSTVLCATDSGALTGASSTGTCDRKRTRIALADAALVSGLNTQIAGLRAHLAHTIAALRPYEYLDPHAHVHHESNDQNVAVWGWGLDAGSYGPTDGNVLSCAVLGDTQAVTGQSRGGFAGVGQCGDPQVDSDGRMIICAPFTQGCTAAGPGEPVTNPLRNHYGIKIATSGTSRDDLLRAEPRLDFATQSIPQPELGMPTSTRLCGGTGEKVTAPSADGRCAGKRSVFAVADASGTQAIGAAATAVQTQVTENARAQNAKERLAPRLVYMNQSRQSAEASDTGNATFYGWGLFPGALYGVFVGGACAPERPTDANGRLVPDDQLEQCGTPLALGSSDFILFDALASYRQPELGPGDPEDFHYTWQRDIELNLLNDFGVPIDKDTAFSLDAPLSEGLSLRLYQP